MTEQTQPAEATTADAPITTYKGFDKNLQCRGFQYAIGQTYQHEGPVEACAGGFHACEHPLNVFSYYAPAGSRFAVVEQGGELSRHIDDTKVASRTITIKAEIDLPGLIRAAIEYTFSRAKTVDPKSPASATGYSGAASATGLHSIAMASGWNGRAMAGDAGAVVLAYRNNDGEIIHIRASKVGDNGIKAGVWYSLNEDGEFVEVEA